MKTILVAAYAVNPYKGSEDGTGWNILRQIALRNSVILITRINNQPEIERQLAESPEDWHAHTQFVYFDLPYWARFWKKGAWGALPYYMLWQMALPTFIRRQGLEFDIAHQLNFHNDWVPTMLWRLKKPVVWGPVGHHPPIPAGYLKPVYGHKAWFADKKRHWIKNAVRKLNPWYRLSVKKVSRILTISEGVKIATRFPSQTTLTIPAVGTYPRIVEGQKASEFTILSVGRFVPLKGFDLVIKGFASFLSQLPPKKRDNIRLKLVGRGPEKQRLKDLAFETGYHQQIDFVDWVPQSDLNKIYQRSHIFLFPSHEGAGMVVPEAMAFGLPVICFDNAGPGELISDDSGVRIPYTSYPKSVTAIGNALEALHGNANLREQMAHAAKRHAQINLSWKAKGNAIQNVYESILSA